MSDDWESVTRIGKSRSGGGGGGGPRPTVVRGQAALNAAMRTGGVFSEKKSGSANSKTNQEGQRDRKVADADGIVPLEKLSKDVKTVMPQARIDLHLSQSDLAKKCNTTLAVIQKLEKGETIDKSVTIPWNALQRHLGIKLTGSAIGQPTEKVRKEAERAAAEKKGKAKE